MSKGSPVAVAMSGGVDSSVAAALLVRSGVAVFGVTMLLGCGEQEDSAAAAGAREVCDALGIEHVVVDLATAFAERVVAPFCDDYARGLTPNPCVRCNEQVKFGLLLDRAADLGAAALATGHYARVVRDAGGAWLARAADRAKDQSYFLYRVPGSALERLLFPLGEHTKAEVRALAAARGLTAAGRAESQEACFTHDHVALVGAAHPETLVPGPIEDRDGTVVGAHRGIARYTVGQRKGLGLGGPAGPYRVAAIDASRNAIVVEPAGAPAPREIVLERPVWRGGERPAPVLAQVRYRARPVAAMAAPGPAGLHVTFAHDVGPLAPGQSVVCYARDRVVGGGIVPARPSA